MSQQTHTTAPATTPEQGCNMYDLDIVLSDLEHISDLMVADVNAGNFDRLVHFENARQIVIDRLLNNSTENPTTDHVNRLQDILLQSNHAVQMVQNQLGKITHAYKTQTANLRRSAPYMN